MTEEPEKMDIDHGESTMEERQMAENASLEYRYQHSHCHPGYVERIDHQGNVEIGLLENGEFTPLA